MIFIDPPYYTLLLQYYTKIDTTRCCTGLTSVTVEARISCVLECLLSPHPRCFRKNHRDEYIRVRSMENNKFRSLCPGMLREPS